MQITPCTTKDLAQILALYQAARNLQIAKNRVVWPEFEEEMIKKEIEEQRQFKIEIDGEMACNWTITLDDKAIWEEKDQNDSIFLHRICNNPAYRGLRFIDLIVPWAKQYALNNGKKYVRLDTLGKNTGLITHYTSSGFNYLGEVILNDTSSLPMHYQKEPICLLFEIDLGKN